MELLTDACVPGASCGCEGQGRVSLGCGRHHLGFLEQVRNQETEQVRERWSCGGETGREREQ